MTGNLVNVPAFKIDKSGVKGRKPDKFTNLNPLRLILDDPSINGYGYIFFTRPDLNITHPQLLDESSIHYYDTIRAMYSHKQDKKILQSLTRTNITGDKSELINILTNTAMSFSPQDTTARTKEVGENFAGHKIILPGPMSDSISGQFSIEFEENQNLAIIKLHKIWLDYMDLVRRGFVEPKSKYINQAGFRILDYVSSVYYFRTLPDAETITYYTKYTGVFPISVPYSSLAFQVGNTDVVKASINYAFSFKEDLDPAIFRDFNSLNSENQSNSPTFNKSFNNYSESQNFMKTKGDMYNFDVNPTRVMVQEVYNESTGKQYKLKFI